MLAFWDHGYDRTSVAALAELMRIRPPSFYAAFGSKEALFLEALELYRETIGTKTMATLESASGRSAIAAFLKQSVVNATTRASSGCLITLGGQVSADGSPAASAAAALQSATWSAVHRQLHSSRSEGALPATADLSTMTDFLITVLHGISLQARRGTKADALQRAAALAVDALPWTETPPGKVMGRPTSTG
ncbi:TetR/AcrR family transcriptional regulator [Stenotrophomonas rhizophila]